MLGIKSHINCVCVVNTRYMKGNGGDDEKRNLTLIVHVSHFSVAIFDPDSHALTQFSLGLSTQSSFFPFFYTINVEVFNLRAHTTPEMYSR